MDGAAHAGIHIAVDTPRRRVYKLEAPDEASRSEWLRSLLAASKATASSPQEDAKGLLGWFGKLFGGSQEKAAMANGEAAPQEAEAEEAKAAEQTQVEVAGSSGRGTETGEVHVYTGRARRASRRATGVG